MECFFRGARVSGLVGETRKRDGNKKNEGSRIRVGLTVLGGWLVLRYCIHSVSLSRFLWYEPSARFERGCAAGKPANGEWTEWSARGRRMTEAERFRRVSLWHTAPHSTRACHDLAWELCLQLLVHGYARFPVIQSIARRQFSPTFFFFFFFFF